MANDCLLKELKRKVQNDNFPFFDALEIRVIPDMANYVIENIMTTRDVVIKSIGGTFNLNGTSGLTQATLVGNSNNVITCYSESYRLVIFDKEAVDILEFGDPINKGFLIDMSQFNTNMVNMMALNIKDSSTEGTLSIVPRMTMFAHEPSHDRCSLNLNTAIISPILTHFRKSFNTTGSVSVFNDKIMLALLDLRNSQVTGEITDFLDAQVSAGRTTGYVDICINNSSITYNGAPYNPSSHEDLWYIRATFNPSVSGGYTINYV